MFKYTIRWHDSQFNLVQFIFSKQSNINYKLYYKTNENVLIDKQNTTNSSDGDKCSKNQESVLSEQDWLMYHQVSDISRT